LGRETIIPARSPGILFADREPTTFIHARWSYSDTMTESAETGRGFYPSETVYVSSTNNRGRGVFARRDLVAGEVIEVCPVIVLGGVDEQELLDKTRLFDYYFAWGELAAVALGYGSLYNHSCHANADHVCDVLRGEIRIWAHRAIRRGEEITINYGGRPDCPDPVWFDAAAE
jgi:hypothetical protein